jgi:hypothetical protein
MAAHIMLPWVCRFFYNLKVWALGVYYGLRRKHLQSYLDEFVFRLTDDAPGTGIPIPARHRRQVPARAKQNIDLTGNKGIRLVLSYFFPKMTIPIKIGFAVISHNDPEQLLRLVKTLNAVFGTPPIVCHHDFSQCAVDEARFPANARFVHPHIVTEWGDITLSLAALRAFSVLKKYGQPDWYFLLSGSDYPVRPADQIAVELSTSAYDAYLDNREIVYRPLPPSQRPEDGKPGRPDWIPIAYYRYCTCRRPSKTWLFSSSSRSRKQFAPIRNHRIDRMTRWFQYNRPARIYGGDCWFHTNSRTIDYLLDDPSMRRMIRYYRTRLIPDESIFHTALLNHSDLKICNEHKRYVDWPNGELHPKWLARSDLPNIIASKAYFARKCRDTSLLDAIDATLLQLY